MKVTARTAATNKSRRRFLAGSVSVLAAGALPPLLIGAARQATAQTGAVRATQLGNGLAMFTGPDGTNALTVDAPDGLVYIDGGHADWSDALLSESSASFPNRPVAALINSHWHPEQTGLNLALGERGVEILAHENTRLWLGIDIDQRWSGRQFTALPPAARPSTGLHASQVRDIAGRQFDIRQMLHAHTDGDINIYLADDDVLYTGGPVSNQGWPIIDWWTGGWIGGMLDAYDALTAGITDTTRIVPARGPLMTAAQLREQHAMYLTIFDRLQALLIAALSPDEAIAERPTAEFDAQYGDPELFVRLAFESMWGHLRDAHDRRLRNIP